MVKKSKVTWFNVTCKQLRSWAKLQRTEAQRWDLCSDNSAVANHYYAIAAGLEEIARIGDRKYLETISVQYAEEALSLVDVSLMDVFMVY